MVDEPPAREAWCAGEGRDHLVAHMPHTCRDIFGGFACERHHDCEHRFLLSMSGARSPGPGGLIAGLIFSYRRKYTRARGEVKTGPTRVPGAGRVEVGERVTQAESHRSH